MRCNYNKKNACFYSHVSLDSDDGKLNALEKKFTKKLEVLENKMGEMKKSVRSKRFGN